MKLLTNRWLILPVFILLALVSIGNYKNLVWFEKKQAPQVQSLVSYIPSWQNASSIQLVQDALPKRQVWDEMDEEEERLKNMVGLVDKVIVIPSVGAAHRDS